MDVERRQAHEWTPGAVGPEAVTWRLVGANNHELGRGPDLHVGHSACCGCAALLMALVLLLFLLARVIGGRGLRGLRLPDAARGNAS